MSEELIHKQVYLDEIEGEDNDRLDDIMEELEDGNVIYFLCEELLLLIYI